MEATPVAMRARPVLRWRTSGALVAAGIASEAIGLITPYAAQVLHLQKVLPQHPGSEAAESRAPSIELELL